MSLIDILTGPKAQYLFLSPFISSLYLFYAGQIEVWILLGVGLLSFATLVFLEVLVYYFKSKKLLGCNQQIEYLIKRAKNNKLLALVLVIVFLLIMLWLFGFGYTLLQLYKFNTIYSKALFSINIVIALYLLIKFILFNTLLGLLNKEGAQ